jgi:thiamine pyrophosphate-dependent acetolactate synthase large subunit-like protein
VDVSGQSGTCLTAAAVDCAPDAVEHKQLRTRKHRRRDVVIAKPSRPHYHHTGPPGGGLGYGAPAAAGAALANRKHGRLTVTIQADGDLMYSPGVLWTCAHSRLPVLYVMHNNRAYHQEIMGVQRMANRRQRGVDRTHIGCTLDDPFIDYATVAKGLGVASFGPITDPDELGPALKKAVDVVKRGEPALVDVVSQGR